MNNQKLATILEALEIGLHAAYYSDDVKRIRGAIKLVQAEMDNNACAPDPFVSLLTGILLGVASAFILFGVWWVL